MLSENKNLVDTVRDCLQLCIMEIDAGGEDQLLSYHNKSFLTLLGYRWRGLAGEQQDQIGKVFDGVTALYRRGTETQEKGPGC